MSRCFPYTPSANQRTGESLTAGSIKLQKESKHSKEKRQKREKKEKRHSKHKNENKKETTVALSQKDHSSLETGESLRKKRKYVRSSSVLCGENLNPNESGKCPVEQLEGSGLSEEHGVPCFIPEPSQSSESTHNSSKSRKLEDAGTAPKSHGSTILRFKLPKHKAPELDSSSAALPPLRKHKDPEPVPTSAFPGAILMPLMKHKEQVTSSALPTPKRKDTLHAPPNEEVCRENKVPECAPINEEPCFSGRTSNVSHQKDASEAGRRHSSSRGSKRSRRSEERERRLGYLLSDLDPASLLLGPEAADSDQGWLLGSSRQQQKDPGAGSCGMDSVVAEGLGRKIIASSFQPVACFMPEFDSYRLPYVLPY